ncbi:MAG: Maltose operon periplasmic protein precursor (MalM) [Panacagrimonas sp.]|jgi:hypothetical protein|nr:MalM family protein [Panacagrimonas sp.]MCC2655944.1 Maltose operon periplasmic protein precursor (MalM) [Panacagrimonas sp.]
MRLVMLASLLLAASLVGGCAGRALAPATVMQLNPRGCDTQWNLSSPQAIEMDSPQGAQAFRVDGDVRCLAQSGDRSVSYAVYRLPRYRDPWTLQLESRITDGALFAPEAMLLDADGKMVREMTFDRFAMRGERLQITVFFNDENASEHYLVVRSAGAVVGRDERHVVSSSFYVPLLAGALPFLYMQGTEAEGSFRYAHNGVVYLLARSQAYSPLGRKADSRAMVRSEFGAVPR